MAHPRDRAAIAAWAIRRISAGISDAQACEIETLLRDEFAEERAEGVAEGRDYNTQSTE
jgi:hypothetical protein